MNIVDRFISFFAPGAALSRVRSRMAIDMYRAYDAAQLRGKGKDRRGANNMGPTSEVRSAGTRLRSKARDTIRNSAYPRRAVRSIPANVVGSGIMPAIVMEKGSAAKTANLKKLWKAWATNAQAIDFDGRKTLAAIQVMLMRAVFESGEVFVIRRQDAKGLQLQVLEADHLDTLKDGIALAGGGHIIQGIQFSVTGKREGYWLFQQHPGESHVYFKMQSVFFPVEDVIHLFEEERPGQHRGVPLGMASVTRAGDFADYQDAQLMRQKIAACFAVFVTKDVHTARPGELNANGTPLEVVEPGMIEYLTPGQEVKFASPPAVEGYGEYSSAVLHEIAAGYDIPYELMTGDYSQVNFSSARMARMEFSRLVVQWQEMLMIPVFCDRVFDWWVTWQMLSGNIDANAVVTATWTAPALEFVDPLKEIKALVEKVRAGFISWQEGVRQLGYDPEEILAELQVDAKRFDAAGIKPYSDPRFDMGREKAIQENGK